MSKYYGTIGFAETTETKPGVWKETVTTRKYFGDIIRDTRRWQGGNQVNDNVSLDNQISIVSDLYATKNLGAMRYIEIEGAKWKISSVEVKYPRLIISIGGVYNGE